MNRFELEGTIDQVFEKTSRNGRKYFLVLVETDYGDHVPLSVWGSPPDQGARLHVEGRLTGYGDFPSLKITQMEIIQAVGAPVRRNWRKPPDGMQQRRGKVTKPVTEHFPDDGSLPV